MPEAGPAYNLPTTATAGAAAEAATAGTEAAGLGGAAARFGGEVAEAVEAVEAAATGAGGAAFGSGAFIDIARSLPRLHFNMAPAAVKPRPQLRPVGTLRREASFRQRSA